AEIDVRPILSSIRVPTLIIHRTGDRCIKVEEGRFLAHRIPTAKFVELPGEDHLPFVGDQEEILREIDAFLSSLHQQAEPDRVLVTILSALIRTTEQSSAALEQYASLVRKELARFRGREVKSGTSRYLATFDGPARAIRSESTMANIATQLKHEVQIGLHTGECDVLGDRLQGAAVEIAAQIGARASSGEVLVSNTVKDLVAGSGITFEDRGIHTIDGSERSLFSALA